MLAQVELPYDTLEDLVKDWGDNLNVWSTTSELQKERLSLDFAVNSLALRLKFIGREAGICVAELDDQCWLTNFHNDRTQSDENYQSYIAYYRYFAEHSKQILKLTEE